MPVAQGLALAGQSGAEARIVEPDGSIRATAGWDALVAPTGRLAVQPRLTPAALIRTAGPAKAWPAGFEVDIDYTIPELNLGRYRPPFVVIWITDEQGKMVRTLFHLGNHPAHFLNSNYVWFEAFGADSPNSPKLQAVTRPSRQPGKYTAMWDGKDDMGNPVGQGRYTVNIETSREHGGHSLQTMTLELGAMPTSGSAAAQQEAGPAAARYGRPAT